MEPYLAHGHVDVRISPLRDGQRAGETPLETLLPSAKANKIVQAPLCGVCVGPVAASRDAYLAVAKHKRGSSRGSQRHAAI